MQSKLSLRIENGILMGFITGERSVDETLQYWQDIIKKCNNENIQYILYTIALRDKFHPLEAIKTYQEIINLVKPTKLQIAVVDLNHLSAKDSQVAINIGASQGLNVAYFDHETQALEWLINSKRKQPNRVISNDNQQQPIFSI